MKKIANYVGAAKIKECLVQVTDMHVIKNCIKPILNFDLHFEYFVFKHNLYTRILHVLKICFVFRLFAELQSLKGKNYMFNLLAI